MNKLLNFLVKNIIGDGYEISETVDGDRVEYIIKVSQDKAGKIIGKGGSTIKAIQDILKIKATLENKFVNVKVESTPSN